MPIILDFVYVVVNKSENILLSFHYRVITESLGLFRAELTLFKTSKDVSIKMFIYFMQIKLNKT